MHKKADKDKTQTKDPPKDPGKTVVTVNIPNTGDTSNAAVYMGAMAVSGAAAVVLLLLKKKKDEETDNA